MAYSNLIIMVFKQRENALQARQALELMRDRLNFGLEHAAEITCDSAGRTALHYHWDLPTYPHGPMSRLPIIFSDAIFGHSAEDRQRRLADAGLDEFFLRIVVQALVPDSSALLIYVSNDSRADMRALLSALALLEGILHHTTIPPSTERLLLNVSRR
jgi:uncharacterized membrane protein